MDISQSLVCILLACVLKSPASAIDQFRAAVYEHDVLYPSDRSKVTTRQQALSLMEKNLQIYKEQTTKAANMNAKIIVFPEYGLYGLHWTRESIKPYLEYIPNISNLKWNPCDTPLNISDTEVQRNLSCMAKNVSIYIVANIGARQPCKISEPNCPPDMHYQFSANVVYGPNGDFIARYFKYNLYSMEKHFDKPSKPDITTFDTPFGRFGTFTSADILFHDPAVQLIKLMNITNIAYPTAWQDELPLMAAIEFHSAFAEGMQINLLAANLHIPQHNYHGSGLYWPTGTSVNASYYYNAENNSKGFLVVEDMTPFVIPPLNVRSYVKESSNFQKGDILLMNENGRLLVGNNKRPTGDIVDTVTEFETVQITINNDNYTAMLLRGSYGEPTVCQGKLCCSAGYEGMFNKDELYAIGAFDGIHTVDGSYYLQACVFIKCATKSKDSCGKPSTSSSSYISKMSFSGNFTTDYVYPEVLTDQGDVPGLVTTVWMYQGSIIIDTGIYGGPLSVSMIARHYSRDP
ncbi:pantetheinase-like [Mercenaria mercenaria]|uniref:pantetheinase-like n=1 Tax=Mercenaria mercenaria TaxID=6596 RepID=UPI00234EDE92|nr:pantetheinase-like [Mercenaria mercenaria]XP_053404143.1 pantetheinase-like [Mercenaria mercenaria]XP_053404145.1 pantetheinase-like [Mercenaria mercenaria]XP_053404146.1 pantetheinase-like [Mercenaria mercenaria]XP_053404147.1 pantetheinase-like [Mercenaria mercenaria]